MSPLNLWDSVALLALFDEVNKVSNVSGNLFIQKTAFLSELGGIRQNLRVAHFRFFRFTMGPYSAQLANHVEHLEKAGAVRPLTRELTSKGRYILEYAWDSISQSAYATSAIKVLQDVAREHGSKSGAQLKDELYELRVPVADLNNQVMKVRDIPRFMDILDPAHDHKLSEIDPFDLDTTEELMAELQMSPDVLDRKSPAYAQTVAEALRRVHLACS